MPAGATLAYTLGGTITAADVVGGALTGTVTVGFDGKAILPVTLSADSLTEGAESITVTIASATSTAVTVSDTSLTPAPVAAGYSLTTSTDTAQPGTETNDTWSGVIGTDGTAAAGTTLGVGDNINGAGGTADKLAVTISGTNTGAVLTQGFTTANVEILEINNFETTEGNVNTLNLAQVTGLTSVSMTGSSSSGDTALTNVRNLVGASMASGSGDLTVTYTDAAVAGTADTQTLTVSGQTAGTFTAQGTTATGVVETLSITSTGSANALFAVAAGATTINVTGDQNLTLTENMTNTLTRINASTFTGNLTFTNDETTSMSITGGSGSDSFVFGANFGSTDSIDGGAGTLDNLTVAASITTAATLANVSNVEQLTLSGANVNATLAANVGPTRFDLATSTGANTLTLNTGYTNATTVSLGAGDIVTNSANVALTVNATAANFATATITGGTATDTLNLTASAESPAAVTLLGRANGVETITIVDGGDTTATAGRDVNLTTGAIAASLTVDGSALDAGLTSGLASDLTNENLIVDGSAVASTSVVLRLTGGGGRDSLTGGAGNDVLVGGAGVDTLTAGTGTDNLSGGDGDDLLVFADNLTAADTVDGGAGTNTLSVTTFTDPAVFANITNVQALQLTASTTISAPISLVSTFDLSNTAAQTLTLAGTYTGATTVTETGNTNAAPDTIINTANVALTVNGGMADVTGMTLTGGTGAETLNIRADGTTGSMSGVSNVETINVLANTTTPGSAAALTGVVSGTSGKSVTVNASALTNSAATFGLTTAAGAGSFVVTGATTAANTINLGSSTASTAAATVTGGDADDTITLSGGADSISAGGGNDAIVAGSTLNNSDVIDGGSGTLDTLSATIGTSATTGVFKISNVETINFTTTGTTTVVNAAGITGANVISFAGSNGLTVTGLAAGTAVSMGNAASTFTGTSTLALADATGASDTLTVRLNSTAAQTLGAITTTGIETLNVTQGAVETGNQTLDLSLSTAATINVTATAANIGANTLALGTLNAATTTVDASADAGTGTFSVTGSNTTGIVFRGSAGNNNITGGIGNDTITIATAFDGTDAVAGGAGTDTLNATTTAGAITTLGNVSQVESMTLTVANAAAASTIVTQGALDGAALKSFTLTGGTTAQGTGIGFTVKTGAIGSAGTSNLLTTFDASGYGGAVDVLFNGTSATANMMSVNNVIKGGSGTSDVIHMSMGAITLTAPTMSGFEKFELNSTGAGTLNLTNTTGLTNVILTGAGATITGLPATGTAIDLGVVTGNASTNAIGTSFTDNNTVTAILASATGAADALTFNLVSASTPTVGITLKADGVETITINESAVTSTNFSIFVTDANTTNPVTINLTGGLAANTLTFQSGGIESNVTSITGTGANSLIMASGSRVGSTVMTITGGAGADTIIQKHTADSLTGGSGSDTLVILQNAILGGFQVDLSASGDQVSVYNGTANAAVQSGFENFDGSNITGSFGIDVTAAAGGSTIVGTGNVDQLTGGAGGDVITGGAGADVIDGGLGGDTFVYATTAAFVVGNAIVDTITGGGGIDVLRVGTNGTSFDLLVGDSFARINTVEQIVGVVNNTANSIVLHLNASVAGINTVNLSANTATGNTINVGAYNTTGLATTLTGSATGTTAITGGSGNDTITGGTGVDTLLGGIGADSINGGGGADSITGGAGADALTGGAAVDTFFYTVTGDETGDVIVGGGGADVLSFAGTSQTYTIAANSVTGIVAGGIVSAATTAVGITMTNAQLALFQSFTGVNGVIETFTITSTATAAGVNAIDLSAKTLTTVAANTDKFVVNGASITGTTGTGYNVTTSASGDTVTLINGTNTITGGTGKDSLTGGTGADTLTGGVDAAADTLIGGTGDDTFVYLLNGQLGNAGGLVIDSIVGEGGTDRILVGTSGIAFTTVVGDSFASVQTVEQIVAAANTFPVSITLHANAETAGIVAVNLSAVTAATGNVINVGQFATTTIGTTLTGSATGITTFTGGVGADTINGGSGNDVITGGNGFDSITAGAGNDTITMLVTATHFDYIDAGAGGLDTLVLSGAAPSVITVDLTSTTDQYTTATSADDTLVQFGFENVDATLVTTNVVNVVTVAATTAVGLGTVTLGTISGAATTIAIDASTLADGNSVTLSGVNMIPTVTGLIGTLVASAVTGALSVTTANATDNLVAVTTGTGATTVNTLAGAASDAVTIGTAAMAENALLTLSSSAAAGGVTISGGFVGNLNVATPTSGTVSVVLANAADDAITITGGASALTVTALATGDTLTVTGQTGNFTGTVVTSGTGRINITSTNTAGSQTIITSAGADTITMSGVGTVSITPGLGADTVTLNANGGQDTVVMIPASIGAVGNNLSADSISNFVAGTGGDILQISLTGQTGSSIVAGTGTTAVGVSTSVLLHRTAVGAHAIATTTTVTVLDTVIASASALKTALEAGGTYALSQATAGAANSDFVVIWTDGVNGHVSLINDAAAAAAATIDAGDVTVTEVVTLTGMASVAALVSANVVFIT